MTPEQEKQFKKLINYATELARQHNELEERVEALEEDRRRRLARETAI
jgi:hypothetical protein